MVNLPEERVRSADIDLGQNNGDYIPVELKLTLTRKQAHELLGLLIAQANANRGMELLLKC